MRYRDFEGVCGEEDPNFPMEEYRQYFREVEATHENFIRVSVPDPDRAGTKIRDTKLLVPSPDAGGDGVPLRHLFSGPILKGAPWIIRARYYKEEYQEATRRRSSRSRPFLPFALKRQADYRRDYRRGEHLPIQVFCTDCPFDPDLKYPAGHWLSGYNRAEAILDGRGKLFDAGMALEFRGLTLQQHNYIDHELNTEHGFPLAAMDTCLMALNYMDAGMSADEAYEYFSWDNKTQFEDGLLGAMLFRAHGKDEDFFHRVDKNGSHAGRPRTPQELGRSVKVFGRTAVTGFLEHGEEESKRRWMKFLNDKTAIPGSLLTGGSSGADRSAELVLGYVPSKEMSGIKGHEERWKKYEDMSSDWELVEEMRKGRAKVDKALKKANISAGQELQQGLVACSEFINLIGSLTLRKLRADQNDDEVESLVRTALLLGDVYGDLLEEE